MPWLQNKGLLNGPVAQRQLLCLKKKTVNFVPDFIRYSRPQ